VRQAEAALDPVDVVAEEAVQRFKSDATAFVGQYLFMFFKSLWLSIAE
jgi:hypothetical protein